MAQQLGFQLPVRTALGRDDFVVSPSNAIALSMIDAWQNWPLGKFVLSGPEGSGKTHLAHVWAGQTNATLVQSSDLKAANLEELASAPLVVEDVPRIAADMDAQTALFHLHNMIQAAGQPLLLTGQPSPNLWRLSLPDLQSRVDAAGHASLEPPDDALLQVVLHKLFADRQLRPRDDVVPYLVKRMERSFAEAGRIVAKLDAQSLAERRDITRGFAAEVLDILP